VPRRCLVIALACCLALGVLSGCGDDDGAGEATAATTAVTAAPTVASVITPLAVDLIDAGAEPRQVLRHDFTVGDSWSGNLEFTLSSAGTTATIDGVSGLEITSVDDAGIATASYALEGLDVVVESQGIDAPDAVDISGEVVVAPDRTVDSATVQVQSDEAIPGVEAIAGALDPRLPSVFFPFPAEPIGPGARWAISGPLSLFGAEVDFVAEAELTSRNGGRFDVTVAIEMRDPVRSGVALVGFGRIQGDTARLGPVTGSIALSGTLLPPGADRPQEAALDLRITER